MKAKFGLETVDVWKIDKSDENVPEFVKNALAKKQLIWRKVGDSDQLTFGSWGNLRFGYGAQTGLANSWLVKNDDDLKFVSEKEFEKNYEIL